MLIKLMLSAMVWICSDVAKRADFLFLLILNFRLLPVSITKYNYIDDYFASTSFFQVNLIQLNKFFG